MCPQLRGLTNGGSHKRRIFGRYYHKIFGFISLAVFQGRVFARAKDVGISSASSLLISEELVFGLEKIVYAEIV